MTTLYTLFISVVIAAIPIIWLDHYFTKQAVRSWLGMTYTVTGWSSLFNKFENRFAYKRKDVELNLIRAGIYNPRIAVIYFPAKISIALALMGGIFFFGDQLGLTESVTKIAVILLVMVAVILVPDIWLQARQRRRVEKISSLLPYVLDLMAVCIQTGMTIESAISYLGEELKSFDKDLAYILRRVDSISRISNMQRAFDELLEYFPTRQMRSMVYTLNQSLQYGSSIFDVLTSLSANIREIETLELEEKVGKLSAKMSIPLILFIMFPIVILITAPSIMRMMSNV